MNRIILVIASIIAIGMMACGLPVEVPPAHVGKLSTDGGLQQGIIQPSKLKLEGACRSCDNLILAEASDLPAKETMTIFMPKDNLNLTLEIRGTYSISSDEENINQIFSRMTAETVLDSDKTPIKSGRVQIITMPRVYSTYAQPIVRGVTRTVVSKYSIQEVMTNRAAIAVELEKEITGRLKTTPIRPIVLELADLQPPEIIVRAQEAAKERKIEIEKAEAQKEIDLKLAQARLEVAQKQQAADLVEAETQVLVNNKLAESVSDAFVTQRTLKFWQTLAENKNKEKVLVIPFDALASPGGNIRAYNFDQEK